MTNPTIMDLLTKMGYDKSTGAIWPAQGECGLGRGVIKHLSEPVLGYGLGANCLLFLFRLNSSGVSGYAVSHWKLPFIDDNNNFHSFQLFRREPGLIINSIKTNKLLVEKSTDEELDAIDLSPQLKRPKSTYVAPVVLEFTRKLRYINDLATHNSWFKKPQPKWSPWYEETYIAKRNKCGTLGLFNKVDDWGPNHETKYKRVNLNYFLAAYSDACVNNNKEIIIINTNVPKDILDEIKSMQLVQDI